MATNVNSQIIALTGMTKAAEIEAEIEGIEATSYHRPLLLLLRARVRAKRPYKGRADGRRGSVDRPYRCAGWRTDRPLDWGQTKAVSLKTGADHEC